MERQDSVQRFLELIRRSHRGKFKVYIGMSAGVGKTCRMLQEARQLLDAGVDVRIGYIETHGRAGTEALVEGLPLVPRRRLFYKGKELEEMDTQAIVNLRPEIVVVDELAHTNIEGSENPKRWQDVMQILDAGISVISAVNIQHIEGLNEVVEEITGIEIRERVPDSVLAMADEVVNIDLTADELIERLKAGKIYRPDKIAAALGNFFTQDNLLQLRELALKEVALRVEKKVDSEVTGSETFRRDKLLAVIDSSEKRARRVIRKTARMATHLNAAFTVLYVQGDREADDRIPLARQRYLINNLNLATELGGEVRRIRSNSPVESIAGVCREQKINIVCIGRPEFSLFSLLKSAIRLRRLTVRLSRMNIDLLSVSAHKIHGPKGVGFLYISEKAKVRPILFGGGQQRGMRSGTENVPGIAGMAKAVEQVYMDLDSKVNQLYRIRERFIQGVSRIEGIKINGCQGAESAPHIVSVSIQGVRSEVMLHALEDKGIYVSAGSACSSNKPAISATLKAIGIEKQYLDSTIRFSFSMFTTEEEIDYTIMCMGELIPMLRHYTRH